MPYRVTCGHCQAQLQLAAAPTTRLRVKCPKCSQAFEVAGADPSDARSAAAPNPGPRPDNRPGADGAREPDAVSAQEKDSRTGAEKQIQGRGSAARHGSDSDDRSRDAQSQRRDRSARPHGKGRKLIIYALAIGLPLLAVGGVLLAVYGFSKKDEPPKPGPRVDYRPRKDTPGTPQPSGKDGTPGETPPKKEEQPNDPPKPVSTKGPGYVVPGQVAAKPLPAFDAKNPGTLDNLDRGQIPPEDILPWYPKELVAIIGTPRGHAAYNGLMPGSLVGFTPDSKHVLTWAHCGIRLWDAQTLQNVSYLSSVDMGGEPGAVNLSPDGRLVALIRGAGCFEVGYQGNALKLGRKLSAIPGPWMEQIDWGLLPDNSAAWCWLFRPTDRLEFLDLQGAGAKPPTTIPLPKTDNGPRVFADPRRKRLAVYSEVRTRPIHRLEIWAYDGASPQRKAGIVLGHEVTSLAFGEADDTVAAGSHVDGWSLLKLQGDTASVVGKGEWPAGFLKFLQFRNGDREILAVGDESICIFETAPRPTLKSSADLKKLAESEHGCATAWAFSADRHRLAGLGTFAELRVWDTEHFPPGWFRPPRPCLLRLSALRARARASSPGSTRTRTTSANGT
jgi:hypothetical protein